MKTQVLPSALSEYLEIVVEFILGQKVSKI